MNLSQDQINWHSKNCLLSDADVLDIVIFISQLIIFVFLDV